MVQDVQMKKRQESESQVEEIGDELKVATRLGTKLFKWQEIRNDAQSNGGCLG
jgi:hypothetical protein